MRFQIRLTDHKVFAHGEVDLYLYECVGYLVEVGMAFGETSIRIRKFRSMFLPELVYSDRCGGGLRWKEAISTKKSWERFPEEVALAHEIFPYFFEHIEELKAGIVPEDNKTE